MYRSLGLVGLLLATACGDDSNRRITDGSVANGDAPTDAPAPATPVTVLVKSNDGPQAAVKAYFQASDSSVISNTATDSTGTASAVMPGGGYVTVVMPYNPPAFGGTSLRYQLHTWAGVKPGDHLVLDSSFANNTPTSVTFTIPIDTQHLNSTYFIKTNCGDTDSGTAAGSSQSNLVINAFFFGCPNDVADVIVYAIGQNGLVASSFSVLGQPIVDGTTVDYSAKAYVAPVTRTFELDNNDDPADTIAVTDRIATANGEVYNTTSLLSDQATATGEATIPALPAGAFETVSFSQTSGRTSRGLYEFGADLTNYTRDWTAVRIPDFDPDAAPDLDTGTHAITWANTGTTGTAASFSLAEVTNNRSVSSTNLSYTWFIAGPATTPSLVLPTLPTDVQDFAISATDSYFLEALGQANAPGGYDAYRATIFQNEYPAVATGKVAVVSYQFNFGFVGRALAKLRPQLTPSRQTPFFLRHTK